MAKGVNMLCWGGPEHGKIVAADTPASRETGHGMSELAGTFTTREWDYRGACDGPRDCVGTERGCAVCDPNPRWSRTMTRERCKCCNRFNPLGFAVDAELWRRVVPDEFYSSVLCIMCFDYFATEVGIAWEEPFVWDEDEPATPVEFFPVSGVTHAKSEWAK